MTKQKFARPDHYFKLQKFLINFVAFWPDALDINKFRIALAYFNGFYVLMICAMEACFAYVHRDNLELMLDSLPPVIPQLVTGIKILVLVYYRDEIKNLLSIGYKLFIEDKDEDAEKINDRMSKYGYLFTLVFFIFSNSGIWYKTMLPIVRNIFRIVEGKELVRELPYGVIFWFETETTSNYLIGYGMLVYSTVLTVFSLCAIDGLFVGFCLYFTAQFEIINLRLNTFMEKEIEISEEVFNLTEEQNAQIYKKLSELVHSHNSTIDLCGQMSKILTINVLCQFLSAALMVCIGLVTLMLAEGEDIAPTIIYVIIALFQVAIYSVGGTILNIASHDIKFAAYSFPWYECDTKVKKIILLMILRADRETGVTVPFFKANVETFRLILNAAMSYITFFKSFL